ncbi:MAG: tRNA (adenosine(37)-N6)-dimethylallyltransferase MiaA [Gammaproteobacteria bacterium]|nr:tRNA (adenosine(37)-N6)-dimethylallyltransferase MiaA [Gammaproteobacteria bacterium]
MQSEPPLVDLPLICLVGPTASGKTDLAMEVVPSFDGEVVAADSRQIYRGMNVGTSKPTQSQQEHVKHHMIDVADPFDDYSVVRYLRGALEAIEAIESRNKVPFLVGGTGHYVEALTRGLAPAPYTPDLRRELERDLEQFGVDTLAERLQDLDPRGAQTTDLRNPRRVLRALEVKLATGHSIRDEERPGRSARHALVLGLDVPRSELIGRIQNRSAKMFENGLLDETRRLWSSGYARESAASRSIGYREVFEYLLGNSTLRTAREATVKATSRYARRQMTWFRNRETVEWYSQGPDTTGQISRRIDEFLTARQS